MATSKFLALAHIALAEAHWVIAACATICIAGALKASKIPTMSIHIAEIMTGCQRILVGISIAVGVGEEWLL